MIRLDNQLLEDLGLRFLSAEHKKMLLRTLYEELQMRVGRAIAGQLTDRQLDDFERYISVDDSAGALSWLEQNCSDYREIVSQEFEKLCDEISALQGEITAVSMLYAE
jgi:hypothetical protein